MKVPKWKCEFNLWLMTLIAIAIMVLIVYTSLVPVMQHLYYKVKVWQEPDRYGYCYCCGYANSHKFMDEKELTEGVWVWVDRDKDECQSDWEKLK